eukprot:TRINITY_DN2285_c0_g1_i1.p1 TRINITY_DN2285_c0_g1~~TRINITY_DN2285_c0_g1_i1.p1  ORF type:complete len:103 (-),score=14.31 TRINITY_DN2285_c0_g1_i1:20-328(-)
MNLLKLGSRCAPFIRKNTPIRGLLTSSFVRKKSVDVDKKQDSGLKKLLEEPEDYFSEELLNKFLRETSDEDTYDPENDWGSIPNDAFNTKNTELKPLSLIHI